jgi:hypothetical protein
LKLEDSKMSLNIPTHYSQEFATIIQLLLQQKDTRLRSMVMTDTHVGEQASPVDQVGKIEMQPVTGRFQPIGRVDAPTDRRWVAPLDFDLNQLIDKFDKLRLLTDPESSYVQNAVNAAHRQFDNLIIDAFFGTALTGKSGTTSTTFPAAQVVAVNEGSASNIGMSVPKLRAAKKLLMAAEVDTESDPLFCAMTAEQLDDLLAEAQVVSTDFNDRPVLVDGKLSRFLGINFIHTELLDTDANSYRRNPVWAKSGMHLGLWNDITTDIDHRKDLQGHPWQAYVYMTANATRLEEEKIVEIKCAE